MKSLLAFMRVLLNELGSRHGTSTAADLKTIDGRIEHEGLSFLTITLSTFGSDFQKSLDLGYVGDDQFLGFSRTGGLPRFLGGFLRLVFDAGSGVLLENPDVDAIRSIRQFTLMWKKIGLPCTPNRERKAINQYLETEQAVRQSDRSFLLSESDRFEEFRRIGILLWADLLSRVDSRIYNEAVVPKHGPGATADQLRGNAKYDQKVWTSRLEEVFPHWEHIIPSESFLDRTDDVTVLEPRDEIPVKVITVPKTLKTPRIIAVEPTCMQYMQQGVLAVMMEEIPRSDNARNLVMFESQEPNQRLAREGSITGTLATLDLSEASDRVSNQHVRLLVANHRVLRDAVDATRSRKADVPGHGVIRLAKYASMGSALCFPFEALVFTTIIFVAIQRVLGRTLTVGDIKSFYGQVRVYGDDIIVPVDYVQAVTEELEAFGLRVNSDKSFWTGRFRESCGKDYYDGHDVTVIYVRSPFPGHGKRARELASVVSLRNQLFLAGFGNTVDWLDSLIEGFIPFPVVESTSPLLGRLSYLPAKAERWDDHLQIPLVRGVMLVPEKPVSILDDSGALLKCFHRSRDGGRKSIFDPPEISADHLKYAGRPRSVRVATRWAPTR